MLAPWQPLLEWWFGWGTSPQAVADEKSTLWFGKHHDADAHALFGDLTEQALAGGLDEWQQHHRQHQKCQKRACHEVCWLLCPPTYCAPERPEMTTHQNVR